ncbi:MAG: zinc-finger domain-containing protein [Betaproteobacteria bacterium]
MANGWPMSKSMSNRNDQPIKVSKAELPISCPPANSESWDSHPRVFLEVNKGRAQCPYCGAHFKLED